MKQKALALSILLACSQASFADELRLWGTHGMMNETEPAPLSLPPIVAGGHQIAGGANFTHMFQDGLHSGLKLIETQEICRSDCYMAGSNHGTFIQVSAGRSSGALDWAIKAGRNFESTKTYGPTLNSDKWGAGYDISWQVSSQTSLYSTKEAWAFTDPLGAGRFRAPWEAGAVVTPWGASGGNHLSIRLAALVPDTNTSISNGFLVQMKGQMGQWHARLAHVAGETFAMPTTLAWSWSGAWMVPAVPVDPEQPWQGLAGRWLAGLGYQITPAVGIDLLAMRSTGFGMSVYEHAAWTTRTFSAQATVKF